METMRKVRLTAAELMAGALSVVPHTGSGGVHAHIAPYDPEDSRIRVGLTSNGAFALVGKVTNWDVDSSASDPQVREWLGGEDMRPPRTLTKGGSVEVWLDNGDTTGQKVIDDAHNDRTPVFLQICPEGTTIGDTVYQVQAYITGSRWQMGGMDGAGITGNFSWRGLASTWTEVEIAA
jgi:hypothetical protein